MTIAARAPTPTARDSGPGAAMRSPVPALTLAALLWSGSFVVARALRADIDPVLLTFLRWLIALAMLAPFVRREARGALPVVLREWRLLAALGATGIALFHPLVFVALQHTTATNALLVLSLAPAAILVGGALVGGERPTPRQLAGVLVSMAGAVVLITRGDLGLLRSAGAGIGDLWMLAAVVIWAAYSLLLRRRPSELSQTMTLVASIAFALPMLLVLLVPALLAAPSAPITCSLPVLLGVGYIAIFGSVVGFRLWAFGVAEIGPARAGQFVHLMPVLGAVLSFFFLGEPLTMAQVAGAAFVLGGIVLIERAAPLRRP
jgi:drug/metabolite transporter (DMT)-like permease